MRDRPDGAGLLRLARATLLDELLGELPEAKRYPALMVASAMAIAARELAAPEDRRSERQALEALLGPAPEAARAAAWEAAREAAREAGGDAAVTTLAGRLAGEIRAGRFDGDPRVHDHLKGEVEARLALSNPKRVSG